jgi:hypothetical protein
MCMFGQDSGPAFEACDFGSARPGKDTCVRCCPAFERTGNVRRGSSGYQRSLQGTEIYGGGGIGILQLETGQYRPGQEAIHPDEARQGLPESLVRNPPNVSRASRWIARNPRFGKESHRQWCPEMQLPKKMRKAQTGGDNRLAVSPSV